MSCGCVRPLACLQTTTAGAINGRLVKKATSVKVTSLILPCPPPRILRASRQSGARSRSRVRSRQPLAPARVGSAFRCGAALRCGRHFDAGRRSDRSTRRPQELIRVRWFTLPKHPREPEPLHVRAASKWSGCSRSSARSLISSPSFPSPSVSVCSIMSDTSIHRTHPAQRGSGNSSQSLVLSPGRLATSTRLAAEATAHVPGQGAGEYPGTADRGNGSEEACKPIFLASTHARE